MYDYAKEKLRYYEALKAMLDIIKLCPDCNAPGELPLPCSECPWRIKDAGCIHALISRQLDELRWSGL